MKKTGAHYRKLRANARNELAEEVADLEARIQAGAPAPGCSALAAGVCYYLY